MKQANIELTQERAILEKTRKADQDYNKKNKKKTNEQHKIYKQEEHTDAGLIEVNKELSNKI